jgi:hypothetical protein
MPRFAFRIASALWLLLVPACLGVWAKPGAAAKAKVQTDANPHSDGPLRVDSAKVHSLYLDGEFEAAIALLEANLKETRQYSHDDSAFIFKHLGVMYAAQYDTREKGKYYMHRLLTVEPTAKILDMYASDMIYMIFRNIQDEFEQSREYTGAQRQRLARTEAVSAPPQTQAKKDSTRANPQVAAAPHSSGGKKWVWGGVAVAAVAAGVGAYFLINDEAPKVVSKDYAF